jgi:hypothetical protein
MHFRVLGWAGFFFLAVGLILLLFFPPEWTRYGCAAVLSAVTLYGVGLWMVARQIAIVRRHANEMLERVAEEMERRQGGGQKVIDVENVDPGKKN